MKNIFGTDSFKMVPVEHSDVSEPFRTLLGQFSRYPLYVETRADCGECPLMNPSPIEEAIQFTSPTRCCTYNPRVANFLLGYLFLDDDPALKTGQEKVLSRIASGRGVTPIGIRADNEEQTRFFKMKDDGRWGRTDDYRCPYYHQDGKEACSIWRYRASACTTWFCRHVRGKTGKKFWRSLEGLLFELEQTLSHHCLLELGMDGEQLDTVIPNRKKWEDGVASTPENYHRLWGSWAHKERAFYEACAAVVRDLKFEEILQLGGPSLKIRYRQFQDKERMLHEAPLPKRLIPGKPKAKGDGGVVHVMSYQESDVLTMPTPYMFSLQCFHGGRTTADGLAAAQGMGLSMMDESTLKTLVDFGILEADPNQDG